MATETQTREPPAGELQARNENLEAELEAVRRELAVKRARIGGIELAAFFALLLGIAAILAVAFKLDDNQTGATAMHSQMSGSRMSSGMSATTGAGAGMMQGGAAAVNKVNTQLGDYWVRPDVTSVPAGKVTFTAQNVGQMPHELMVERMPIKMDAPGKPNENAAQGMIDDVGPGESGHMSLNLKPGTYMLFCNVPGHYAMGQHTTFQVTG